METKLIKTHQKRSHRFQSLCSQNSMMRDKFGDLAAAVKYDMVNAVVPLRFPFSSLWLIIQNRKVTINKDAKSKHAMTVKKWSTSGCNIMFIEQCIPFYVSFSFQSISWQPPYNDRPITSSVYQQSAAPPLYHPLCVYNGEKDRRLGHLSQHCWTLNYSCTRMKNETERKKKRDFIAVEFNTL